MIISKRVSEESCLIGTTSVTHFSRSDLVQHVTRWSQVRACPTHWDVVVDDINRRQEKNIFFSLRSSKSKDTLPRSLLISWETAVLKGRRNTRLLDWEIGHGQNGGVSSPSDLVWNLQISFLTLGQASRMYTSYFRRCNLPGFLYLLAEEDDTVSKIYKLRDRLRLHEELPREGKLFICTLSEGTIQ